MKDRYGHRILFDSASSNDIMFDFINYIRDGLSPVEAINKLWEGVEDSDHDCILTLAHLEYCYTFKISHVQEVKNTIRYELSNPALSKYGSLDIIKKRLVELSKHAVTWGIPVIPLMDESYENQESNIYSDNEIPTPVDPPILKREGFNNTPPVDPSKELLLKTVRSLQDVCICLENYLEK